MKSLRPLVIYYLVLVEVFTKPRVGGVEKNEQNLYVGEIKVK